MENHQLLLAYIVVWTAYLGLPHAYAHERRLSHWIILASQAVPSVVAVSMIHIFLIGGGETVAQFAVGSRESMDMWSLWVDLWPVLYIGTLAATGVHVIWLIAACVMRGAGRWIPVVIASTAMCIFAFLIVCGKAPTA